MSQPVKLSDALVLDARLAGKIVERSIAGQVEFWAQLGRAVELLLRGDQVYALSRRGSAVRLSAALADIDTKRGRKRVHDVLESRPFPHYEAAPGGRGQLVRIDADGKRTVGRFVNRKFKATRTASAKR
jgi:hypothetical protein